MSDLLLPEGVRLLHVGPHKTGTTALQGAFSFSRDRLREHGVVYPGVDRQHWRAALGLTGHRGLRGVDEASTADWDLLVRQVNRTAPTDRVVISSEFFGEADDVTARRIVAGLGEHAVHVLITLRPLAKILPSAWQQYVRNGLQTSYGAWLEGMLLKPPYTTPTPSFWRRHHHDVLAERWCAVVSPARVTVLVLDETDPRMLMSTAEQLLGLPQEFLVPEPGRSNRSLTLDEAEVVREVNRQFARRQWPPSVYHRYVHVLLEDLQGRKPGRSERPIVTPDWALQRAAEMGAAMAEKIATLDVNVIGDLSTLSSSPAAPESPAPTSLQEVRVHTAAAALIGAIAAGEQLREEHRFTAKLGRVPGRGLARRLGARRRVRTGPVGPDLP